MPARKRPPPAVEAGEETLPGLDQSEHNRQLRRDLVRVREERDEALSRLVALTDSTPPPTRRQRAARGLLVGSRWVVALPLFALLARAAAKQWPEFAVFVDALLAGLGL